MGEINQYENYFIEISENELVNTKAGGLGLCIVGAIGGTITGALGGVVTTPPCPVVGAAVGGVGLGIKMGVKGWKK